MDDYGNRTICDKMLLYDLEGDYICILYYDLVETRSWDGKKTTRLMLNRASDESEWKWNLQA